MPHTQGFVLRPWCWIVERTPGMAWGGGVAWSKELEPKSDESTLLGARNDMRAHGQGGEPECQREFQNTLSDFRDDPWNAHDTKKSWL